MTPLPPSHCHNTHVQNSYTSNIFIPHKIILHTCNIVLEKEIEHSSVMKSKSFNTEKIVVSRLDNHILEINVKEK